MQYHRYSLFAALRLCSCPALVVLSLLIQSKALHGRIACIAQYKFIVLQVMNSEMTINTSVWVTHSRLISLTIHGLHPAM